ncbi:MAG TPA: ferritin [Geomonas sp.]
MESRNVVLRKEGDARGYYERCSAETEIPELSRFFTMLSEDEVRHDDALRALQSGARVELAHSTTLDSARYILRHLSVQDAALAKFNGDLATYGCAMDFEAASVRLCGQLARDAEHKWEKELYLKIAAEDEMHFTLLEHMRELLQPAFCADRGSDGVSDAY